MPQIEGGFPKSGGDPLYSSEVNRFAEAGGFSMYGRSMILSGARGDGTIDGPGEFGSILIPGGSLWNPTYLTINIAQLWPTTTNTFWGRWGISGVDSNTKDAGVKFGSIAGGTSNRWSRIVCFLGSPDLGILNPMQHYIIQADNLPDIKTESINVGN